MSTPSVPRRGWRRSHRRTPWRRMSGVGMPAYARVAIPILLILLIGRLAHQGAHSILHPPRNASAAHPYSPAALSVAPWERDVMDSLETGARDSRSGNLSAAEMDVDRAESIITAARIESRDAQPDFFSAALAGLDGVLYLHADNQRLFDHVTLARTSLASLRSSLEPPAAPAGKTIGFEAPREIPANRTLDPASLGGTYLDATLLPDTLEILLPPPSRSLADNILVENITIAGAAQTLDGFHWRNVTFIDTRLRYESGDLDLQNARFVRCRFGLPSDARGARLANALALGQSSITIQ